MKTAEERVRKWFESSDLNSLVVRQEVEKLVRETEADVRAELAGEPKFKVGDRVKYNAPHPFSSVTGTVIAIDGRGIKIEFDGGFAIFDSKYLDLIPPEPRKTRGEVVAKEVLTQGTGTVIKFRHGPNMLDIRLGDCHAKFIDEVTRLIQMEISRTIDAERQDAEEIAISKMSHAPVMTVQEEIRYAVKYGKGESCST